MATRLKRKTLFFSIALSIFIHSSLLILFELLRNAGFFALEDHSRAEQSMTVVLHISPRSERRTVDAFSSTGLSRRRIGPEESPMDEKNRVAGQNQQKEQDEASAFLQQPAALKEESENGSAVTQGTDDPSFHQDGESTKPSPKQSATDDITCYAGLRILRPDPKTHGMPVYPRIAKVKGYEGTVYIRVKLDSMGKVTAWFIEESSGYPSLDSSALRTVRKWVFHPAKLENRSVEAECIIPVTFSLRQ